MNFPSGSSCYPVRNSFSRPWETVAAPNVRGGVEGFCFKRENTGRGNEVSALVYNGIRKQTKARQNSGGLRNVSQASRLPGVSLREAWGQPLGTIRVHLRKSADEFSKQWKRTGSVFPRRDLEGAEADSKQKNSPRSLRLCEESLPLNSRSTAQMQSALFVLGIFPPPAAIAFVFAFAAGAGTAFASDG